METRKRTLGGGRKRLLELMQRINFGAIEGLGIRSGDPVFDPAPLAIRDIKIGAENGARPEARLPDFSLKSEILELFSHLDEIETGTIRRLEVKHGLPFRLQVEQEVTS